MEIKCNVCNKMVEVKPGNVCDHQATNYCGVAKIELDEGRFIGYRIVPIQTQEELDKIAGLPTFQIEEAGILGIEPAFQYAREHEIDTFIVFVYAEEKI